MKLYDKQQCVSQKAIEIIENTGLTLKPNEIEGMEIVDFGLDKIF